MSEITVLIPVAEAHRFLLPRALDSLTKQTYQPDILVVNDAAGSLVIPEIKVIDTGGQKGTAYARNLGLDHVKTPYVFFMDADDALLDTALELMLRALAEYDACYIYSDWYQYGKNGEFKEYKAKPYNRLRLLRHSLHLVNILLPTDIAKSVYYDINYRGWEDWEFHIRLGLNGYCGARVPEKLLIYDMTTSINREAHNAIQDEVYAEILNKYGEYLREEKGFMACTGCGGNKGPARQAVATMPPPMDGFTVLEYIGANTAPVPFKVNGRLYRGANDESFRFVQVQHQDVQALMDRGPWRKVVKAAKAVEVPRPEDFNAWREVNKTEVPKDWAELFKKNALQNQQGQSVSSEPTVTIQPPKPRGRPKGSKNRVSIT